MLYTINWLEEKDYNGAKFLSVRVKPLDGSEFEATMWGDKWGEKLSQITPGMQLEANPWQNPKNGKWSLYPPDPKKAAGGAGGASRTASIAKAQEKKEASIEKSQDRKEESIKMSAAQRDAVIIVKEFLVKEFMSEDDVKDAIVKWRNWFLSDEFTKDMPPF